MGSKLLWLVSASIGKILSCIVPRDRGLCVAGSWMGEMYGDNPRYFVEYLLEHSDMRIVWIGKEHVREKLPSHPRLKFALIGSICAAWAALRANCWIVAQGEGDIAPFGLRGKALLLNLWHGLFFKCAGATRADGAAVQAVKKRPLKARILGALTRRDRDSLGWTSIASAEGGRLLAEAMPQYFSTDLMLQFGTPRNDYLIRNRDNEPLKRETKARYAKMLGFGEDKKIVLYLPTFRKPGARVFSFYGLEGALRGRIASFMDAANATVVEKHHFVTLKANPPAADTGDGWNIVIGEEKFRDVLTQELLLIADVLVTDYSSVFIDYCLLDRPCIHYVYDLEEYTKNDAGLGYDIEKICGGPCVKTVEELTSALENALEAKCASPRPGYRELVAFERGNACEQIANWLMGR